MLESITKAVKSKKEFSSIPDEYVLHIVTEVITKKETEELENHPKIEKSQTFKKVLKEVRKVLHETHGLYQLKPKKRNDYLKELEQVTKTEKKITPIITELHDKILSTHQSTKERLLSYEFIYGTITKKIPFDSVLDLSSGINPVSWIYFHKKNITYYATELAKDDVDFLNEYFRIMKKYGIKGTALQQDLLTIKELPKTDVCFIFKVLDNLETLEYDATKELLKKIPAKTIIASFPKTSISGKVISTRRLKWFERLLTNFETFETTNEIFYIISV